MRGPLRTGPTGPTGLGWYASQLYHRINRLSRRSPKAPSSKRIERDLMTPEQALMDAGRAYLIKRYLRKRPDWPEGQTYLICDAL